MAGEQVFVDTNILAYSFTRRSPLFECSRRALADIRNTSALMVSVQVLRELTVVLTRLEGYAIEFTHDTILEFLEDIRRDCVMASEDTRTLNEWLRIEGQYQVCGKQVHDAFLVATMLANGCRKLLTNDKQHFQRFAAKISILELQP